MLAIFKIIESQALARGAAVELAQSNSGSLIAYFPQQYQMTLALLSPLAMILLWSLQQLWDSWKGDKRKTREDIEQLKAENNEIKNMLAEIKGMLGTDLDTKIEKKIERAFNYYEKGSKH